MIIQSPGDVFCTVFNAPIYWYGIILALAVLVGVISAEILAISFKEMPSGFFIDNSPIVIVTGILGARLYYCLVNFSYYAKYPVEILDFRQGGLSVHGMLFAGILSVVLLAKKYNVLRILDILACSTALAQSIGRWGNFFNSEAFGIPTFSDWGVFIPFSHRPVMYLNYELFHPTFLYESFFDLLIFFILYFSLKKFDRGYTFFFYLFLYSVVRFFVEGLRVDNVLFVLGLPIAQLVSIILLLVALAGIFILFYLERFASKN